MKAKKSYKKGGKMEQRSKNPKSSSSGEMNLSNSSAQSALDKVRSEREEERRNTKAAPRAMKAKNTYKAGGRVPEPIGMGAKKAKLKKAPPGRSARSVMFVEGAMNQMKANNPKNRSLKALGKTVAEIEEAKKKNKRRKRFDNGGKVTGAKTEKSTAGMSWVAPGGKEVIKKRKERQLEASVKESRRAKRINESEARRAKARPDYKPKKKLEEGLRDDDGRILNTDKLRRLNVTKLETASPGKKIQQSTAKIPVPAKKRRLRKRK